MMTLRYKDEVMDNVWNNFFNNQRVDMFSPVYDAVEGEKEYLLTFELPGVEDDRITIELKDRDLKLEVEDENIKDSDSMAKFLVKGRKSKSFSKTFKLPEDVNADSINAKMNNGVLVLTIGKKEQSLPKKVAINVN